MNGPLFEEKVFYVDVCFAMCFLPILDTFHLT